MDRKNVRSKLDGSKSEAALIDIVSRVLNDYYGRDSQSPQNIEFVLNELHRLNRKAALGRFRKLLNYYTFLDVRKVAGAYTVTNKKGITKARKADARAALEAVEWSKLTRLSNHPDLKADAEKEKKLRAKKRQGVGQGKRRSVKLVSGGLPSLGKRR